MNVALYGSPSRWAMTERGRSRLMRDAGTIGIGASGMSWDGQRLIISIDETAVPIPSSLRGTITVAPRGLPDQRIALDRHGRHRWQPLAPLSDVEARFEAPALRWSGTGYVDTNDGDEPLEAAFRSWTWSRFDMGDHARIFYDVVERDQRRTPFSFDAAAGTLSQGAAVPCQPLATTGWGIRRDVPCEIGERPQLLHTMENAPFYARSAVRCRIDGVEATGVHESLSLTRVASPIVRLMLPFRMPRRA